ncbi:MAG: AAA family ATPase, partial [Caldilineales bacterium]|nr:AAA family ATPase [Caldilineales bacterium]
VFNVLLQVLDDGRLTDGHGRTVDFRNTVIIMTSNIGSHYLLDVAGRQEEVERRVMEALRASFRPEFLNRIDEIVIFHSLTREHLYQIVDIQLERLRKLLAERRITLEVTQAAKDLLIAEGYEPAFGARPLKRVIQRRLQDPLALDILRGEIRDGDHVIADRGGDEIVFTVAEPAYERMGA